MVWRLIAFALPCPAAQPSLVNVSITTINCSYPVSQVVKCFLPIPVISTNPLAILLADPTAFLQSADKILLSVCLCCSDKHSRRSALAWRWQRTRACLFPSAPQIQQQFDRATTGPLAVQLGDLCTQLGVDVKDVMSALRQGSNFIGGFRVNVLQNIQQRGVIGHATIAALRARPCMATHAGTLRRALMGYGTNPAVATAPDGPSIGSLIANVMTDVLQGRLGGGPDLLKGDRVTFTVRDQCVVVPLVVLCECVCV
jgi:hypothetical protein